MSVSDLCAKLNLRLNFLHACATGSVEEVHEESMDWGAGGD